MILYHLCYYKQAIVVFTFAKSNCITGVYGTWREARTKDGFKTMIKNK